MAKIPQAVLEKSPLLANVQAHFKFRSQGKVRDSYDSSYNILCGSQPGVPRMLVVASDRCSIFDFVLNTLIPQKGEVLTALNYFWVTKVIQDMCETDMIACGSRIDGFVPPEYMEKPELQKRATVVRTLPAPEIEDIVRLVLTGSGWKSYQENQTVCGHKLPAGLNDGSLLPYPIYTPTTKAVEGHDVHMSADKAVALYGFQRERLAIQVASMIANYAASRGIRMADTKFEFSGNTLVDEKGTPDSSRFVDEKAWQKAVKAGKFPASLDKQYVREWGKKLGIDKRDPENPEDVAWVHAQEVPADVVEMTTRIYRYIFWRLTGMKLERFQREEMGIVVKDRKPKVTVVVGSESDLPQVKDGICWLEEEGITVDVNVISCHRNVRDLSSFVGRLSANIVIAGAGEAAALPGIIKSQLSCLGYSHIPVIGVAFKGKDEKADMAARLSIENLPGQPVELSDSGQAYFGSDGFLLACKAADGNEFLPKKIEEKPAKYDVKL
jgi:phosphoribosylaminoimidazole-succinocarboxamide synthase